MSELRRLWALAIPLASISFGILTAWPALFLALGLALYVALMRECFKRTIPWPWARKALLLDKRLRLTRNPSPGELTNMGSGKSQVVTVKKVGESCTIVSHPAETRYYRADDRAPDS